MRIRQVSGAAVKQRDIRRDLGRDAKLEQRCLQDVGTSAGDLQNVTALFTRHARERLLQQAYVQPHTAKAAVGEADRMERSIDLRRRAAVVVQPLVLNNSFHDHRGKNKAVTIE
jgi:hypothetical protein